MIRKLLRLILGPPTGDIYIVWIPFSRDGIIGASTKTQGAERIRADHARDMATHRPTGRVDDKLYRYVYDQTEVTNIELQDGDA